MVVSIIDPYDCDYTPTSGFKRKITLSSKYVTKFILLALHMLTNSGHTLFCNLLLSELLQFTCFNIAKTFLLCLSFSSAAVDVVLLIPLRR